MWLCAEQRYLQYQRWSKATLAKPTGTAMVNQPADFPERVFWVRSKIRTTQIL